MQENTINLLAYIASTSHVLNGWGNWKEEIPQDQQQQENYYYVEDLLQIFDAQYTTVITSGRVKKWQIT